MVGEMIRLARPRRFALFNSLGGLNWRLVIGAGSGAAVIGALWLKVQPHPNRNPSSSFDLWVP